MNRKTLGILGGMGPEATLDLFRKIIDLTPAKKDQDHIHIIIDNYPQIPDRTAFILHGGIDPAPFLVEAAVRLEKAGAEAIIMPCNTAHFFLPQIKANVKIPFISIIESTLVDLKKDYPAAKTVLPLATTGTKKAGIYDNALKTAGYNVPDMPDELQDNLMRCIYEGVKKGKTDEVVDLFQETVNRIAVSLKPDVLIAACTEIPILTPLIMSPVPVIDATMALACAGVAFALGA